jgi:multiple sugar transport system substrate-binding protein
MMIATLATHFTSPEITSDVPVLYWVTDTNEARFEQIELFYDWLIENGHTTPDGRPFLELRLDTAATFDVQKKIVQAVSGVAGDIIDSQSLWSYQSMGILEDLTEPAKELGFDMSYTFPALESFLTIDGHQYGFPCNVTSLGLWINKDTFADLGMEVPPTHWDFATFERIGKEFVKRANTPGERQDVFFLNSLKKWEGDMIVAALYRSLGLSAFNETLTACTLDDPRHARILELIRKWTHDDHIIASAAAQDAFSAQQGQAGGGSMLPMLQQGKLGMMTMGSWCLISFRKFKVPVNLTVVNDPCDEFQNSILWTRPVGIYKGSKHKEKALLFPAFLASEAYNRQIVASADSMPPNPKYTYSEEFERPPDHPNEWGARNIPRDAAVSIGIPLVVSPFVAWYPTAQRQLEARQKVLAGLYTAEEAAVEAAMRVNEEIKLNLKANPALAPKYEKFCALQEKIDQYRAAGKPVPEEWIKNAFHKKYYAFKGWLEVD